MQSASLDIGRFPVSFEAKIEKIIHELLCNQEYIEFPVGRDGNFDQLISSTVLWCKQIIRNANSPLIWILLYPSAEYQDNADAFHDYYDDI